MRLRKFLKAVSWTYALGEILLIVIGVTLALAATSWYEDRQERLTETEMLDQIRADLVDKRASLEDRLRLHQQQVDDIRQVVAFLDSTATDARAVSGLFRAVGRFYGIRLNTSVYEVLKSRGLDLVSDSSLRNHIVTFLRGFISLHP